MPLDHNNRILVHHGLARINARRCSAGILAILSVANKPAEQISSTDLGFVIGPRLNAAGRLDDMQIGIKCLLAESEQEGRAFAKELDDLNRERRAIEASMKVEAERALQSDFIGSESNDRAAITLYKNDWHQGVVGIVASRIKERFHKPTIVFAEESEATIKGSGRSIPGIHLRDVLDEVATATPGLLSKFGGHAMAAGLSINKRDLEAFSSAFNDVVESKLTDENRSRVIFSDGELPVHAYSETTADLLTTACPWGQGFPEPQFHGVFHLVSQRIVGQKHLKLVLAPDQHTEKVIDAIFFNIDLEVWPNQRCEKVFAVFKLAVNEFRGQRTLQFMIEQMEAL